MDNISDKKIKISLAIILTIMTVVVIVLATFLGVFGASKLALTDSIDNIYSRAYYNLLESNLRLENNLSKLGVLTSKKLIETTIVEIARDSESASTSLNTLIGSDESLRSIIAFYNQLGDYHSSLLRLLDGNEGLSLDGNATILSFATRARDIGIALNSIRDNIGINTRFTKVLAQTGGVWSNIISQLDNTQQRYPSLIYDGPFSDGVIDRIAKGVTGDSLNYDSGLDMARKYLVGEDVESLAAINLSNNRIPSVIYSAKLKGGRETQLSLALQGGLLLMREEYRTILEPNLSAAECEILAEQYCRSIGLDNMKAVWISVNNSIAYINLCYTQNGAIIYGDMVKVKIAMDNGNILGYEGLNYAFNHTNRTLVTPTISKEDAMLAVNSTLKDLSCRLTLIPITQETEKLCYEISGVLDNERYFIYIDVITHQEISILRVINSNQGELLM